MKYNPLQKYWNDKAGLFLFAVRKTFMFKQHILSKQK